MRNMKMSLPLIYLVSPIICGYYSTNLSDLLATKPIMTINGASIEKYCLLTYRNSDTMSATIQALIKYKKVSSYQY